MLFVDAANREFFMDARRDILEYVLCDELPVNIPILVAANKQDLVEAMSPEEVKKKLNLEKFVGNRRYKVLGTSGLSGEGMDEALDWIVESVQANRPGKIDKRQDIKRAIH